MMAAIKASGNDRKVTLIERNEKLGKKLFITGKGRCNVTTDCPEEDFFTNVPTNPRFLYSSFAGFTNHDMMAFLEKEGLKLKVERGQRVFPASDRSADVLDTLKRCLKKAGVRVMLNSRVKEILCEEDEHAQTAENSAKKAETTENSAKKKDGNVKKHVIGVKMYDGTFLPADAVILATGGASYPQTGSTGDGYDMAAALGHKISEPQPSLVPFVMEEKWCRELMGLSLKNVAIRIRDGKKEVYKGFGEFLFTHFGVSGPLVLTASTCLGKYQDSLKKGSLKLILDLKPALDPETLDKRFMKEFDTYRNKNINNVIETMLPKSLVPVYLMLCGIDPAKKVRDITKKERMYMVETMKNVPMHIKGVRGFEEAIVTRGGVTAKQIDPKTMESRLIKGLFFAGELIDVDAVTGGYNLQIAWSTGNAAGRHA